MQANQNDKIQQAQKFGLKRTGKEGKGLINNSKQSQNVAQPPTRQLVLKGDIESLHRRHVDHVKHYRNSRTHRCRYYKFPVACSRPHGRVPCTSRCRGVPARQDPGFSVLVHRAGCDAPGVLPADLRLAAVAVIVARVDGTGDIEDHLDPFNLEQGLAVDRHVAGPHAAVGPHVENDIRGHRGDAVGLVQLVHTVDVPRGLASHPVNAMRVPVGPLDLGDGALVGQFGAIHEVVRGDVDLGRGVFDLITTYEVSASWNRDRGDCGWGR